MARVGLVVTWLVVWALPGCKSDEADDAPRGRGSAACQKWQGAICAWAERCGAPATAVADCRDQASALSCLSDEQASSCTTTLAGGACTQATAAGCDITDLADPAPAMEACSEFVDAFCASAERCAQGPKADCVAEQTPVLCAQAIGVKLSFESCVSEISKVSCTATALPTSCRDVILQGQ